MAKLWVPKQPQVYPPPPRTQTKIIWRLWRRNSALDLPWKATNITAESPHTNYEVQTFGAIRHAWVEEDVILTEVPDGKV